MSLVERQVLQDYLGIEFSSVQGLGLVIDVNGYSLDYLVSNCIGFWFFASVWGRTI